jgi:hypothetical protein
MGVCVLLKGIWQPILFLSLSAPQPPGGEKLSFAMCTLHGLTAGQKINQDMQPWIETLKS